MSHGTAVSCVAHDPSAPPARPKPLRRGSPVRESGLPYSAAFARGALVLFFLLGAAAGMLNVIRAAMREKTPPLPSVKDERDDDK